MKSEPDDLNEIGLRDRAVRAAQGKEPFDVLVSDCLVADMVTGELRPASVGLTGSLIASVHPHGSTFDARRVINAQGCIVTPGLIDMHMHIESSMISPAAYANEVLPRGVTTVVWDPHEFGNTCGMDGMDYALRCSAGSRLRILTLAPSCVPSAPGFETTGADFTPSVVKSLLSNPDIHGLAEVMSMRAVLDRDQRFSHIVGAGLQSGKRVCGHARGLRGGDLNAYIAAGIETDHEIVSGEDFLNKLQSGLTVELRGSHDHLLPEFVDVINKLGFLPQTVTLCTDDVFIDDLVDNGGLDDVVRRLINYGLPPLWALQAATFNAANRLGRNDLGLVAPGKRADLVILDNLEQFNTCAVLANGQCVADAGGMLEKQHPQAIPAAMRNTMQLSGLSAKDFKVAASSQTIEVATIEKPRFTEWGRRTFLVRDGYALCPDDMTLMAIINRFGASKKPRIAYLGQWGVWEGAFATTVSHDSHNLTVFGGNEDDMALAANVVREQGGGLAVVSQGRVLANMALPVAGLISEQPTALIAEEFRQVRLALDTLVTWQPPYLVFKACFGASLVCNPGPRLSDVGIVDSESGLILETPIL